MTHPTIVIIGAGLVGLATAYQLQRKFPQSKITLLEKEDGPGRHQSGHNSGVIHSGIYYRPGSMKAENCIRGYRYLLDFCQQNDIPYKICGKLIVATDEEEVKRLGILQERAVRNGLNGVQLLDTEAAKEKEPYVNAKSALWVPQTGVVDYRKVAICMADLLKASGTDIHFGQQVLQISRSLNELVLTTLRGEYKADYLINCAGLYSDRIAVLSGVALRHRIIPFRGEYWMLSDEAAGKVNGLIYPVPQPELPFLGVHLTRMISGKVEAGPNAVLALKKEGYRKGDFSFKEGLSILTYPGLWKMGLQYAGTGAREMFRSMSKKTFVKAVQRLLPDIDEKDLLPAPAGVRAQALWRNGHLADDFLLLHGQGMTHVCNAPSPAATSCLAIGEYIAGEVMKRLK